MKIDSIKFKGHRCFKNDWVGFDEIKPINIIIGRNNSQRHADRTRGEWKIKV